MKQQTLDISQWRTVTLERWKTKETNPTITQAYCSEFPSCVMGEKKRRQSPGVSLHWDEEAQSVGRPGHLDFTGPHMWETNSREKNIELSQQTTDQCMHVRKLPKDREEPPKGNSAQHTHKAENSTYSHH